MDTELTQINYVNGKQKTTGKSYFKCTKTSADTEIYHKLDTELSSQKLAKHRQDTKPGVKQ